MYCIKCGEKLNDGSIFCCLCGARQAVEQQSSGRMNGNFDQEDKYSIYRYEPLWNCWYVKDLIGSGSFGKVYLVYREEFGETYYSAVKHIAIPRDDLQIGDLYAEGLAEDELSAREYYKQVLGNILKEVKTNYELKGQPNIVLYEDHAVMERSETYGYDVFIKMELLTDLNKIIKSRGLSEREVAKLGIDICSALEVMNKKKILHRDIKPANIFITDEGTYKLGDFGIARHMEKTVSSMSVKGTFAYMPPEIQKGAQVDNRADIYSLGLVMYRLLNANRAPFLPLPPAKVGYEESNLAVERRLKGEKLLRPHNAGPAMSSIILKACSFNKEDRWQNAAELKQILQSYLQGAYYEQGLQKSAASAAAEYTASMGSAAFSQTVGLYSSHAQQANDNAGCYQNSKPERPAREAAECSQTLSQAPGAAPDNNRKAGLGRKQDENQEQGSTKQKISNVTASHVKASLYARYIACSRSGCHLAVLQENGSVEAIGFNNHGQCDVKKWYDIIAVSAGMYHTVGLRTDGRVIAVGSNPDGRCDVDNWRGIVTVVAGLRHTVGLKADGTAVAVGWNAFGMCNVSDWRNIIAVSAELLHTVGLRQDKTVVAVGRNDEGQCNVNKWRDIIAVAAGRWHTVGLKSDGTVLAVGNNDYGQCNVTKWKYIVAIAAGTNHTVGLMAGGHR